MKSKILSKKITFQGREISVFDYQHSIRKNVVNTEIINHRNVSAILPILDDKIILEKQYRIPHGYVFEIPAGTMKKGEGSKQCAIRELKEETGYVAKNMHFLMKIHPAIDFSTEKIFCYVASDLKKIKSNLENDEDISLHYVTLKQSIKMIFNHQITDSKTISAIFAYYYKNHK